MRRALRFAVCWLVLLSAVVGVAREPEKPSRPGPKADGFLLPNGWTITPAGEQFLLTDLPLNILPLADGRRALVATSGYNSHELVLVDLATKKKLASQTVRESWFGLAANAAEDRIWWSGGGGRKLHRFELKDSRLAADTPLEVQTPAPSPAPQPPAKPSAPADAKAPAANTPGKPAEKVPPTPKTQPARNFKSGILLDAKRNLLYSLDTMAGSLTAVDLAGNAPQRTISLGGRPYDLVLTHNGARLYVSNWSTRNVAAVNLPDFRPAGKISVGEHPNQMALHPIDGRIFVACASSNSVSVIDTERGVVTETISTTLFPKAPEGSTPDALAVAPDGETLYVANADNNCVAVVDVSVPGKSQVKGFIPTGWYPTSIAVTPDGKQLLVGVGKGNRTQPNPIKPLNDLAHKLPIVGSKMLPCPYIGTTLSGPLSIVPVPGEEKLAAYTETVYRNCPYSDKLLTDAPHPRKTAIPTKVGEPSPIKHVIYIIKENRTYDQVFGDVAKGNGDASLVMFGERVTPNHHKLANEFVLLDNLYCNGHVSADGHPWSTAAYNTDYIARNWALTYSQRQGIDDDDDGDLSNAPSGYLWDACARKGLSYRSYGELGGRVSQPDGTIRMEGRVPGLVGHMCPTYGNIALNKAENPQRDFDHAETFLKEFREFEKAGNLPSFMVMSLGEDHTTGTSPGTFTPQACVASNDLALGRIVEAVSKSKLWPQIAIFVIEDDAQNGPDHVDAHRTVGLVISPYVRRKTVDSTQYTTVSMVRTMELILGLPPLSQYDAAAQPMFACFSDRADLTPYQHEESRIDLAAKNGLLAYGAERSSRMDFSEYDRIDDFELNEILWRAVKGKDAPLPPAVRRAIAYRAAPAAAAQ